MDHHGGHHHSAAAVVTSGPPQGYGMPHGYHHKGTMDAAATLMAARGGSGGQYNKQQTITIHDTPSPTAVITISDSEDESPQETKRNTTVQANAANAAVSCSATVAATSSGTNNGK